MSDMDRYLRPTTIVDSDAHAIRETAERVTAGLQIDKEKAIALYYFVRDTIRHNAYSPLYELERYKATAVLEAGSGTCQNKSVLLCALARAVGIPARIGFVDVNDYQLSEKFKRMIGGINTYPFHGFAELHIDGRWVHASPAYDIETCRRKRFVPVEFDGVHDAKDSTHTEDGEPHIEHLDYHGPYDDFPWEELIDYYKSWAEKLQMRWEDLKEAGEKVRRAKSWGER